MLSNEDGNRIFYAIIEDITERERVRLELERMNESYYVEMQRYKLLQEATDEITFDYNVQEDRMELALPNDRIRKVVKDGFWVRQTLTEYIYRDDVPYVSEIMMHSVMKVEKSIIECRIDVERNGSYCWHRIYFASFADQTERIIRIVGSIKDIEKEREEREAMKHQINYDAMTGLLNKMAIQMLVKDYLKEHHGDREQLHAMIMVDTDHFKAINDNLGHMFGDDVIKNVAATISETFRDSDYVARVGGDEFMIFMKKTTREAVMMRAAQLNAAMRKTFERDGITVTISCSIGIALYDKDGTEYETLYANADNALYEAKKQGRDCYHIH